MTPSSAPAAPPGTNWHGAAPTDAATLLYRPRRGPADAVEGLDIALHRHRRGRSWFSAPAWCDDLTETPDDYADRLAAMRARGLTMLCANPDLVVHRGAQLAIAPARWRRTMRSWAATVIYYGKPHLPIYDAALAARAAKPRTKPAGGGRRAVHRHQGRQWRGAGCAVHRRRRSWRGNRALYCRSSGADCSPGPGVSALAATRTLKW